MKNEARNVFPCLHMWRPTYPMLWSGLSQYKELYPARLSFVLHWEISVRDGQNANTTNSIGLLTCEFWGTMVIYVRKKEVFSMPFVDKGDKHLTSCSCSFCRHCISWHFKSLAKQETCLFPLAWLFPAGSKSPWRERERETLPTPWRVTTMLSSSCKVRWEERRVAGRDKPAAQFQNIMYSWIDIWTIMLY